MSGLIFEFHDYILHHTANYALLIQMEKPKLLQESTLGNCCTNYIIVKKSRLQLCFDGAASEDEADEKKKKDKEDEKKKKEDEKKKKKEDEKKKKEDEKKKTKDEKKKDKEDEKKKKEDEKKKKEDEKNKKEDEKKRKEDEEKEKRKKVSKHAVKKLKRFLSKSKGCRVVKSTTGSQCKLTRNKHGMVTRLTC